MGSTANSQRRNSLRFAGNRDANAMLEDEDFIVVGTIRLRDQFSVAAKFDQHEAQGWSPAIYAFRIAGEVVRIGATGRRTLGDCVRDQWERLTSRALGGDFPKGGTNPWEAFEWRRRLREHGKGQLLARHGTLNEKRDLILKYDPPLNNDSPSAQSRPQEARGVHDTVAARLYWQRLNHHQPTLRTG